MSSMIVFLQHGDTSLFCFVIHNVARIRRTSTVFMIVACLFLNPVLPANRLIHIVTAYLNGLSLLDDLTVLIGPQDHGCPFSTPAYRPDFADLIRQAKEALRPLKEVSLKIGPKTEAHDRC